VRIGRALLVGVLVLTAACTSEETAPPTTPAATSTTTAAPTTTSSSTTTTSSTSTTTSTSSTTTTTVTTTTVSPTTTAVPTTSTSPTTPPATTTTTVPSTSPSVAVYRIPTEQRVISLTFDAGSDLGYTGTVLDVLAEYGVQASFGITGDLARAHPDHVRRMAREGHVVMNHSDVHASFTGVSSDDVLLDTASRQADLLAADAVLAPLIGQSTAPYWRPPFGDYDDGVLVDVGAIGYATTVMWTFDSLGWRGLSAEEITARVLDRAEPGAIVVMHVGSQSADGLALPAVIDGLRAAGYRFTTIGNAFPG
jgi:peptidoglycan/xylan/chitin deacetylase (PgdA/CDA1 family)